MSNDSANVSDEAQAQTSIEQPTPDRQKYLVTSASGLFKNGKQYRKGSKVPLDELTAKRFAEAGDVELPEEAK